MTVVNLCDKHLKSGYHKVMNHESQPQKTDVERAQHETRQPQENPSAPARSLQRSGAWQTLRGFGSFISFVGSVILLAIVINLFVFQSYYVDGTSMNPTLQPNERLIINKIPRTIARATHSHYTPKRGEIIVFNSSLISTDGRREQLIKRVIGLPGERVIIDDGKMTIFNQANPKGFDPDSSLHLTLGETDGNKIDVTVPENELFVVGDNRQPGGSYDSRSNDIGTISTDDIVGELLIRLLPVDKARFF